MIATLFVVASLFQSAACEPIQMPSDDVVRAALAGNLPRNPDELHLIFDSKVEMTTSPSVDGTTSYGVIVDSPFNIECFRTHVDSVLLDERSWPGLRPAEPGETPQVWIRLAVPANACGQPHTFAHHCAAGSGNGEGEVRINYQRWNRPRDRSLSLFDAHAFVLNHEVGHMLGFEHRQCSVMGGPGYGEWAECDIIFWPTEAEQLEASG